MLGSVLLLNVITSLPESLKKKKKSFEKEKTKPNQQQHSKKVFEPGMVVYNFNSAEAGGSIHLCDYEARAR